MKQTIKSVLVTLTLALAFFGCSKNSSDGSTTVAATTYSYQNGICYASTNGALTQVATTLCTTATNGYYYNTSGQCVSTTTGQIAPSTTYCTTNQISGYQLQANGLCYQTSTGQQVPVTYCSQNTGTGTSQICSGYYQDPRNGQTGICYGANSNCSTLTMINLQTGQTVLCQ